MSPVDAAPLAQKRSAIMHALDGEDLDEVLKLAKKGIQLNVSNSLTTPLVLAIKLKDADAVRKLIKHGARVNCRVWNGSAYYAPLQYCACVGNVEICRILLANGAHVHLDEDTGDTQFLPLVSAAEGGRIEIVRELLAKKADPNAASTFDSGKPLRVAVSSGDLKLVRLLIKYGADYYFGGSCASNPLCCAEARGDPVIMKALLEANALKLNSEANKTIIAPLCHAASRGHNLVVEHLLSAARSIDDVCMANLVNDDNYSEISPLCRAAQGGHNQVFNALLVEGGNVDFVTLKANTPLHFAAINGHLNVCKSIVEHRENANEAALSRVIDATDKEGDTPLHMACLKGHFDVLKYLIEKGARLNVVNKAGSTLLHQAVKPRYPFAEKTRIVEFLLSCSHEFDMNVVDVSGNGPLHYAADGKCLRIVEMLLAQGADASLKNEAGCTPLDFSGEKFSWCDQEGIDILTL